MTFKTRAIGALSVAIICCLPLVSHAQVAIRNLPQTAPSASDLFPFARPSGGTWVTDLTGILSTLGSYAIPPTTVLNCTPPIQCNGGTSAYLNTPVTVSISTSGSTFANIVVNQAANGNTAYTSNRFTDTAPTGNFQLFKNAAGSTLWQVDITGSLSAGAIPVARLSGTVAVANGGTGVTSSTGTGSTVRNVGPILQVPAANQQTNGDIALLSTRATDVSPTGSFLYFQSNATSPLFVVDITGTVTNGIIPVARVTGLATSATTDTTNATNISSGTLNSARLPSIAHSSLTSLSADDHTIYALLAGRSGGQSITCGTAASDNCTIKPTSNATMGVVNITGNSTTLPAVGGTGTLVRIGNTDTSNTGVEIQAHAGGSYTYIGRSNGTAASPTALAANDVIGGMQWFGYGTAYTTARAAFQCIASQAWTGSNQGVQCDLYVTPNNSTTITKAWSIDNAGHQVMSGTAPAVTCTGTGTSPSTPTVVGTDGGFTVTMFTGTGTPANTGTCTVTFNKAYGASPPIVCMLVVGASSWANEANIQQTTESASAPVVTWVNEASTVLTGLTASSNYKFSCIVMGR